ncbi:UNVERIFIED_CONTAM: DnaJ sub A member 3, mitochondrial [Siphonaria sp. JEL0065]|nr:DnaJ sub A member 3, mitochondrial [Siphonaria sp. JEL0065]
MFWLARSELHQQSKRYYAKMISPSPLPWKHTATPYTLLGVSKSATAKEIKQKYYELSFSHHPDRTLDKSISEKEQANQEFLAIQDAYEVLKDASIRREYDLYGGRNAMFGVRRDSGGKNEPPGEMKIFKPWVYASAVLIGVMVMIMRSVVSRKEEMQKTAWEDWAEAKRLESVYDSKTKE